MTVILMDDRVPLSSRDEEPIHGERHHKGNHQRNDQAAPEEEVAEPGVQRARNEFMSGRVPQSLPALARRGVRDC